MRGLRGRVAVVSGGAAGIGLASCRRLGAEGSTVVIADVDAAAGRRAVRSLDRAGIDARFVRTDIREETSVRDLFRRVEETYGRLDVLVQCAAAFVIRGLEAEVREWEALLLTDVMGTALCVKHAAPVMAGGGGGSIVLIGSISGFVAQRGYLTYNTAKGAIANMTRCLALDLAPHRIRVNSVCPGTVWTANNAAIMKKKEGLDRAAADAHPAIGGAHMLGRVADPEEIASAVAFLASDEASFVTAENLMVDGGYTAR